MEKSTVYFTDFRCPVGTSQLDKLKKLCVTAGIKDIDMDGKFVAIKMHFGELGNLAFLRPNYAKAVADLCKEQGGLPFLTDCNTLYPGSRKNALEHLECANLNGFNSISTGCQIIIGDGLRGTDEVEVPVVNGEYCQTALIGHAIMDADIFISLSHFKGHEATGFGGALKNIGMGCGSRAGKMKQHASGKPAGDGTMYLEHFVEHPRHIEFQILADKYGNVVHLGERDCSIQRNHQKMIEESPSEALTPELRQKMGEAAVKAAKAAHYTNAGTIEFLLEKSGAFYFMEMNTRIQVEHPVTEWVTGIDLIKEQIKIADGQRLKLQQKDIKITGHAIECRINAENPEKNFRPSPGKITDVHFPGGEGVRVDSAIYTGYEVPPYYDSMLAKLIVHADDREEAIRKMRSALGEVIIEGVDTNIDYQYEILNHKKFISGDIDVEFIGGMMNETA